MADQGLPPPYLDPGQYPAYIDLQRKQMLAQALMQNTQQSAQNPQDWNSMRIVPHRSALSNVATLASALMAGKAQNSALGAQKDYFQGMMGGQPAASAAAPQAPPSSAPGILPPNGVAGSQGPPGPAPAPPAGLLPPQQPPPQNNSMLLPGTTRAQSQGLLTMMGPAEYGKAVAGQYAPTDLDKLLDRAGIQDPSLRKMIAQQAITKTNYIAPTSAREGAPLVNADGSIKLYNPKVPEGSMPQFGPDGMPTSIAPIPGAAASQESASRAKTLGETEGKYSILPTAGGGSRVVGGPTAAPAPAATTPRPTAAAPASQDPWASMPKLPVSSSIGAPDAFTHGRLVAAGAKDAELASQYGKEADIADQKLQYNTEAIKALPNAEVGPVSEWLTEKRAWLKEIGMPDSVVPSSGTVTPTIELNKFLKNTALQGARQIYGKGLTNMDVKLQTEEMSPSPTMTRDAIASLVQQDNIKQLYAKQRAEDYGKYIQNKGDPMRFESWYAKTNPLTQFAKQHAQDPAMAAPVTKSIGGKTYVQQDGKWFEQ